MLLGVTSGWPLWGRPVAYIGAMYKWHVSYFGKVGRPLGTVEARDEASARLEAIDFYNVPANQQFRVIAVKIGPAKAKAIDKAG
jgi:hypothetical protein